MQNVETQLEGYVRFQGGGAQAVALSQNFSRAMVARLVWSAYLQAIRTVKMTQHFVDGIGSKVMNGRNCRLVSTLHIPKSVVPAFAAARFDRDAVYEEFAQKFGIAMATVKFHDEVESINSCMHTETRLQNYVHANNEGTVDAWGFQELSYSFTDIAIAGCLSLHDRVPLNAAQTAISDRTPNPAPVPHDDRAHGIAVVNYNTIVPRNLRLDGCPYSILTPLVLATN